MKRFHRFNKIKNYYDNKNLSWWLRQYPELNKEKYIVTEKIHGANFSVWFFEDGFVRYAKRSSFIPDDANFFNWNEAFVDGPEKEFVEYWKKQKRNIAFYGELFGANIQKGIDYGSARKFRIFDAMDLGSGSYLPPVEVKHYADKFDMYVPVVGMYDNLTEALSVDVRIQSRLGPQEGTNICEGCVIRPANRTYEYEDGSFFVIKKKNKEFLEIGKKEKNKTPGKTDNKALEACQSAGTYITENRMHNVFSKIGRPSNMENFSDYIKAFSDDVLEDLKNDLPEFFEDLDKKQAKTVNRFIGASCANMLKTYIHTS